MSRAAATANIGTDASALRVVGEMTIYRAAELKAQLQEALAGDGACAIDLSEVTEIDCSGVQLLALASRAAAASQRKLQLLAPSPAAREVLDLLNLDAALDVIASAAAAH